MKIEKNGHLESRRRFLASLASGVIIAPAILSESHAQALSVSQAQAATPPPFEVRLASKYYPKPNYLPAY